MKKICCIIIATILITAPLLTMTGCQDAIFTTIRKEVKLEDASISGDIKKVIRYSPDNGTTSYLYLANGDIHYKLASASYYGAWAEDSGAPDGPITQIAADGSNLYCLAITYKEDSDEGKNVLDTRKLYYSTGVAGTWTEINTDDYSDAMDSSSTVVILMCTNAPQNAHRSAYIRIGDTVYTLNGSSISKLTDTDSHSGYGSSSRSAVYFNNIVYFFDKNGSCTNETADTDAGYIYFGTGKDLRYSTNGSTYTSVELDCDDIESIAVVSDAILIGTDSGIVKTDLSGGVPGNSTVDFDTNANSTLSSDYVVQSLLAVTPSKGETSGSLYATLDFSGTPNSTSAQTTNIGLWAYYSTRGNWNRE